MSRLQQAYISKVHLKGYKSIRDLEIDFKPGLNIIIGPNGSGKTNFSEGLIDRALMPKFNEKSFVSVEINDSKKNVYEWTVQIDKVIVEDLTFLENDIVGNSSISKNGVILKEFGNHVYGSYSLLRKELKEDFYKVFNPIKIGFGNVKEFSLLDNYGVLKLDFKRKSVEGKLWLRPFDKDIFSQFNFDKIIEDFHLEDLLNELKFKEDILKALKTYTPIEDFRIKQQFVFNKSIEQNIIGVDFLLLEFFFNNAWHTWNELSDGTKRIFYCICQIVSWKGLIILEEPELGIHPDQLYKLMDFIKEQSEEKQIIITTHSPEVLSILNKDEIDRIIVTRYDAEKGTQMHHLSAEKTRKAQIYIEETGDLSSFWVHSNLEEYDAEETEN